MWTSGSGTPYLGITAHWINSLWKPCSITLDLLEVPYPHVANYWLWVASCGDLDEGSGSVEPDVGCVLWLVGLASRGYGSLLWDIVVGCVVGCCMSVAGWV